MRSSSKTRDKVRQTANAVAIPLGVALNCVPFAYGRSVGVVAREHEPLLAAAGWTFSIWGVIFMAQIAYAVFQALPKQRRHPVLRRIGWHTALNGLLGGIWTVAFTHHEDAAALVTMMALLANLVLIDIRLGEDANHGAALWLARVPLGLNLGWIAAAAILNVALFLHRDIGWNGSPFDPLVWSLAMVVAAALLALVMALSRQNLAFAVAIAWSLAGIADYRRLDTAPLALTAVILAMGLVVLVIVEGASIAGARLRMPRIRIDPRTPQPNR